MKRAFCAGVFMFIGGGFLSHAFAMQEGDGADLPHKKGSLSHEGRGLRPIRIPVGKRMGGLSDFTNAYFGDNLNCRKVLAREPDIFCYEVLADGDSPVEKKRSFRKAFVTRSPRLIDIQDCKGNTPLHLMVIARRPAGVKVLIDAGADLNLKNKICKAPLHTAVELGCYQSVHFLVQAVGVDINVRDGFGRTALYLAVQWSQAEILKALIEAGANERLADSSNNTPFSIAVLKNEDSILNILCPEREEILSR
jgi:ankyrin repeat protein